MSPLTLPARLPAQASCRPTRRMYGFFSLWSMSPLTLSARLPAEAPCPFTRRLYGFLKPLANAAAQFEMSLARFHLAFKANTPHETMRCYCPVSQCIQPTFLMFPTFCAEVSGMKPARSLFDACFELRGTGSLAAALISVHVAHRLISQSKLRR